MIRLLTTLFGFTFLVGCQSSYTITTVVMNKQECGGAFGMAISSERLPQKGEVFYVKKGDAKPKPIKVNDKSQLIIKGKKGKAEVFIAEKITTDIEMPGSACNQWRITPDFVVPLKKGKHTFSTSFDVICNPCKLPAP